MPTRGLAWRARERGRDEQRDEARKAAAQAAAAQHLTEEATELLRASCHPLGRFATLGFRTTAVVGPVVAAGLGGVLIATPEPDDPTKTYVGYLLVIGALAVLVVMLGLHAVATSRTNAAWEAEKKWLAGRPFQVRGLERGVASTSSRHRLRAQIVFRDLGARPLDRVRQLLPHVDPGGTAEVHDGIRVVVRVAGEPEGDLDRVRARRVLLHDLADGVFTPLHETHPIEHVDLDS